MPARPSPIVATLLGVAAIVLATVPAAATSTAGPPRLPTRPHWCPRRYPLRCPQRRDQQPVGAAPRPRVRSPSRSWSTGGAATRPSGRAVVAERSTGLDAMRAAGLSVRLDGGFVCGIDGLPATGCGNRPAAGLAYWRYWHAPPGGAWTYSQVGAGGYRLPTRCAVEGWVWSDAATADTPPRIAAPRPTCDVPPAPTAPPATVRPPATAPPVAGGGGAPPPATAERPAGTPSPVPGSTPAAGAAGGSVGPGSTAPPAVAGASTVAPGSSGSSDPGGEDGSDDVDPEQSDGDAGERAEGRVEPGDELASATVVDEGSTSPPWGALIGVVLIAVLGGAAVLRSRAAATRCRGVLSPSAQHSLHGRHSRPPGGPPLSRSPGGDDRSRSLLRGGYLTANA